MWDPTESIPRAYICSKVNFHCVLYSDHKHGNSSQRETLKSHLKIADKVLGSGANFAMVDDSTSQLDQQEVIKRLQHIDA